MFFLWHPPPSIKLPINKSLGQNAFITPDTHGGDTTSGEIVNVIQVGLANNSFANANWDAPAVLASVYHYLTICWLEKTLSLGHFHEYCI